VDIQALDKILAEPESRVDETDEYLANPFREDGWVDQLSGLGTSTYDRRNSATFSPDLLDAATAAELWRGSWLATKLIETFPDLGTRKGFELNIQTGKDEDAEKANETAEDIESEWEDLDLVEKTRDWSQKGRGTGGALMVLGVKDGSSDLTKPLNMKTIRSLDYVSVFEADDFDVAAWYANALNPKYNRPALFRVSPIEPGNDIENTFITNRMFDIHESRCVYHPGVKVSNRHVAVSGHGDSVLNRVYRVMLNCATAHEGVAYALQEIGIPIFKIKGLAHAMKAGDRNLIPKRMRGMQLSKSLFRGILMDLDEIAERLAVPLTGVAEILDRVKEEIAAAYNMPVTYLWRRSPAGQNATGDSDILLMKDDIEAFQRRELLPPIKRATEILLAASKGEPKKWKVKPRSLVEKSMKQDMEARKLRAEIDKIEIEAGIIQEIDATRSRHGGDEYSFETKVDMKELERIAEEPDPEPPPMIPGMPPQPGAPDPNGPLDPQPPKPDDDPEKNGKSPKAPPPKA
jgi:phage-related protein (TIGR01555 family)